MNVLYFCLLLIIYSCSTSPKQEDLRKSWIGKNPTLLDKHKFYSALSLKQKYLINNEIRYNFIETRLSPNRGQTCFGMNSGFGGYQRNMGMGASSCNYPRYKEDPCIHQFIIRSDKIIEYNILGKDCLTDCEMMSEEKCK